MSSYHNKIPSLVSFMIITFTSIIESTHKCSFKFFKNCLKNKFQKLQINSYRNLSSTNFKVTRTAKKPVSKKTMKEESLTTQKLNRNQENS